MELNRILISAINAGICNRDMSNDVCSDMVSRIIALSESQDVAHLIASPLGKFCDENQKQLLKKQQMLAVYRREQQNYEEKRIFSVLNENNIDFIPLKGAVIKSFYPQEWMRTSSDIDILIKPEDGERAVSVICESLEYQFQGKSIKDYQLYSKNGVHLELHFSLKCDQEGIDAVVENVWDHAVFQKQNQYRLSNEFILFYIIAHGKYHFASGGCGIKPLLDYWIVSNNAEYDQEKFLDFIKASQCEKFYEVFHKLANVWFGNETHSEITLKTENYILSGGAYGTRENLGKASVHRKGGKIKYVFNRIFKPKKELQAQYPNLEKYPMLLPFYQIKRWFNLFNKERRFDVEKEFSGSIKENEFSDLFKKLDI